MSDDDDGPVRPTIISGRAGDSKEDRSEAESLNAMVKIRFEGWQVGGQDSTGGARLDSARLCR
ncbi:BQ5605_C009g05622 [Microbotryum silenes-dioicae]|uniref:BQ5605_C009g05622 protein n=1 Tax=Microbotryum silenes-dioicae TaxID=796604 RepID=A0A2X0MIA1_9BASI|nr:BQ5605_C009g05622 [Microbotryum silenes-dioicae]